MVTTKVRKDLSSFESSKGYFLVQDLWPNSGSQSVRVDPQQLLEQKTLSFAWASVGQR